MEAAVSTGKVNHSKSRILQSAWKWNQSSASGDSEAQVGNRSENAARSMAEHHGHTNQDAGSPRHAGARRSLLSQTQLLTASPKYLAPPQRRPVSPLCAKAELAVPDRRMRRTQAPTAAWTGAWQCLRLLKLTAPLSALSALQSHARPAAGAAFVLPQG